MALHLLRLICDGGNLNDEEEEEEEGAGGRRLRCPSVRPSVAHHRPRMARQVVGMGNLLDLGRLASMLVRPISPRSVGSSACADKSSYFANFNQLGHLIR